MIPEGFGEAAAVVTKSATKFLETICLPAAEEYGLWWRDAVNRRRMAAARIAANAAEIVQQYPEPNLQAPPRIVAGILETGSWSEDEEIQHMWAGLLASSCSPGGLDDSNLVFVDLLSRMTSAEVRFINHTAENEGRLRVAKSSGVPVGEVPRWYPMAEILQVTGCANAEAFREQHAHFASLGLFSVQGNYDERLTDSATIAPYLSDLALTLYVRSRGFRGSMRDYFEAIGSI